MLVKSVKLLIICLVAGLFGGCSTPCRTPGRFCAPISSSTSALIRQTAPRAPAPDVAVSALGTYSVASPEIQVSKFSGSAMPALAGQTRIALLLPLHSETLGTASESVRAGFMAAYERDRAGLLVTVIGTGDNAQQILETYKASLDLQDIVVGPLSRSGVAAVVASGAVDKPTIALNYPEVGDDADDASFPPNMLVMGLSMEDEARQVALWAGRDHPAGTALILSSTQTRWQRRLAHAFETHWQGPGRRTHSVEMRASADSAGYIAEASLAQLKTRILNEPPALVFAALDTGQLHQVRAVLGNEIPIYGSSSLNPGNVKTSPRPDLDGVRLFDLPWQLQPEDPAIMEYQLTPVAAERRPAPYLERLYALGIDAFRVAREIALKRGNQFKLDGVTGRLSISFGAGPASFARVETPAIYQEGQLVPVSTGP